jgi:hypothetical protein
MPKILLTFANVLQMLIAFNECKGIGKNIIVQIFKRIFYNIAYNLTLINSFNYE